MVCGHGGDRSTIGLDDISGLFLSQIFYEHMILYWVYIVPEDSFSDVHKVEPEFWNIENISNLKKKKSASLEKSIKKYTIQ